MSNHKDTFGPKGLFGSFGAGIGAPLELAVNVPGVECFQLHVPEEKDLTADWARRVKELIEPNNIQIARFVVGYSGPDGDQYDNPQRVVETVGFGVPDHAKRQARLALTKRYIEFGHEQLGVKDFNAHLGHIDPENEFFTPMVETVREVCDLVNTWGGHYDVETGPERFEELNTFMKAVDRPDIFRVNLDLANIVLYHGEWEPIGFLRKLLGAWDQNRRRPSQRSDSDNSSSFHVTMERRRSSSWQRRGEFPLTAENTI